MAKKQKQTEKYLFTVGGNLSDGSRFEAGEEVSSTITADDFIALTETGAIKTVETVETVEE